MTKKIYSILYIIYLQMKYICRVFQSMGYFS